MGFDIYTLIEAIWIIIPAYAANGLAPLARGRRAIDGGARWRGRPLLGPGKTWEGTALGVIAAALVGAFMAFMRPLIPFEASAVPLAIAPMGLALGALVGLGAMVGDMVESIGKRQLGIARGEPLPVLDQVDFVLGALVFASAAVSVRWEWVLWLVLVTPIAHYAARAIAYSVRFHSKPW